MHDPTLPLVSAIIPTKNSSRTLERCLRSVRNQTYPRVEAVVVDADSTDGTQAIASKLASLALTLRGERSTARNLGAHKSSGLFLLFVDSDMYLSPAVVEQCVSTAGNRTDTIVIVPEEAMGDGFWARCRALEKEMYQGDDAIEAARFFPVPIFKSLGGFDESLGPAGEDWDLTMRARKQGHRVARVNALAFHDESQLTLQVAMRKKYYYGRHLRHFLARHGKDARSKLLPWRRAYSKNLGRLFRDPRRAIGLAVLKTGEFVAAGAGLIASVRPSEVPGG